MAMPSSVVTRLVHSSIAELEQDLDLFDDLLAQGEGHSSKVRLLAYAGYRNDQEIRLKGRIVRYEKPLDAGEGLWTRLSAMMEIYNSNELAGIPVRCEGYGQCEDQTSDEEGYFNFQLMCERSLPTTTQWEKVTLSTPAHQAQQPKISVPVMAPGSDNRWGIISDIDDTVVETGASN